MALLIWKCILSRNLQISFVYIFRQADNESQQLVFKWISFLEVAVDVPKKKVFYGSLEGICHLCSLCHREPLRNLMEIHQNIYLVSGKCMTFTNCIMH